MKLQRYLWTGLVALLMIAAAILYIPPSFPPQRTSSAEPRPPKIDRLKWKYELVDSAREFIDEELRRAEFNYGTAYVTSLGFAKDLWEYPKLVIAEDNLAVCEYQCWVEIYDLTESQVSAFKEKLQPLESTDDHMASVGVYGQIQYHWEHKVTTISPAGKLLRAELMPESEWFSDSHENPTSETAVSVRGSDGLLRVLTDSGYIIALDQAGNEVWKAEYDYSLYGGSGSLDLDLGQDNSVYLTSPAWSRVRALGPDGKLKWDINTADVFPKGDEFAGTGDFPNQDVDFGVAGGPDGTAYIRSRGGSVAAITIDGKVKWCYRPEEAQATAYYWISAPVLGPDGSVFVRGEDVRGEDGLIIGITPYGQRKWAVTLPGGRETTRPVVGPDGTVYVISGSTVYALLP